MILYVASVIIWLFICFNLFYRSQCGIALKIIGTLIILIISLKYEAYQFLGGAFFAPQLPRWVLLAYEALYGAFIFLFFLFLLWDIYLLGNYLLARAGIPVPQRLPYGLLKTSLCLFSLLLGIWGTWESVKVPDVQRMDLAIKGLPSQLDGARVVQLTDIHIGPILKKDWLNEVVNRVNALDPDLILLTGDYVDGYVSKLREEVAPLGRLRSRYGIFAVTGNHEYYWDMPAWRQALEELNIKFLENEHRIVGPEDAKLIVAGIPDLAAAKFGHEGPDIARALANAPAGVKILLSHQPREANQFLEQVDLMLSGHTHGGLMFFLQPLIARFNAGYVHGLYPLGDNRVYVSPGTGLWNGLSCRIGVPSEITLFTLKPAHV